MDSRLLQYYTEELSFLRETAAEFAKEYPKIAGRLALDSFECADPYVERLLEGVAFLTARIQLRMTSEYPQFTSHLMELLFPNFLAPIPSMAVVEFQPDLKQGSLASGFTVPKNSTLRGQLSKGEQTRCTFRTGHPVTMWPIQLVEAKYHSLNYPGQQMPEIPKLKAAVVLKLKTFGGVPFNTLPIRELPIFIGGSLDLSPRIYEQCLANCIGLAARDADQGAVGVWTQRLGKSATSALGFDTDEAMLPTPMRSFDGYRLLQEYFACPERYRFVQMNDLDQLLRKCSGETIELAILLDRADSRLANRIGSENFSLFCTPAINLFPKRADRIFLDHRQSEHQIIPDRTRPLDFEVHSASDVVGYGSAAEDEESFLPFYNIKDQTAERSVRAYYTLRRMPRVLSANERWTGGRASYIGSETFISLVDKQGAALSSKLQQLGMGTLCTNRDLPLQMPVGVGSSDFSLDEGAPVSAVKVLVGPTKPKGSKAISDGESSWRLISHLALHHSSLQDHDQQGAVALRELLSLYADENDSQAQKCIDGVRSIQSMPITRPISKSGPIGFGRGIELRLLFEENAFEGLGCFTLASVLERFFSKIVSINSFTETVLTSLERGEIKRWPARTGLRQVL